MKLELSSITEKELIEVTEKYLLFCGDISNVKLDKEETEVVIEIKS
jgi:hypothetical protein